MQIALRIVRISGKIGWEKDDGITNKELKVWLESEFKAFRAEVSGEFKAVKEEIRGVDARLSEWINGLDVRLELIQ